MCTDGGSCHIFPNHLGLWNETAHFIKDNSIFQVPARIRGFITTFFPLYPILDPLGNSNCPIFEMFLEFHHLLQLCHQPHLHPPPLIHIISWPLYCFLVGPPAHDSQNDFSKQLSHTLRLLPYDSLQGLVHYSPIPISSLFTFYLCFTLSFPISLIGFPPVPDHGIQCLYLRAFPHTIFFPPIFFTCIQP